MSENRENENVSRTAIDESADTDHGNQRSASGAAQSPVRESGGPKGLEPTRYGDWEKAGRCIDF